MSGSSPSRRIRTKTTELTDFFRGTAAPSSAQKESSSVNLEVPSSDTDANSKKRVKIQLFGRSRKKSNQSTASSPISSSRDSSEFGTGEPSIRNDRRPPTTAREPPPPLPTAKPNSISIGSKLAATFGHSRLPKPSNYTQTESALVARPSTLSPSTSRAASYESGSSNGSRPRSTTPRPSKPLITVSLSPDNVSEYKNLFTRPRQDPDLPPTPSSPPDSRFQKCDPSLHFRRGQTPASAIAAAHRDRSTRKNSDSDKDTLGASSSGAQESPRATTGEQALPPSLQRRPLATGSVQDVVNPRLRVKSPNTHVRSRPPSIPLPQTPVISTPQLEIESFHAELEATGAQKPITRARAHTIGSVVSSSLPATRTTATLALDLPEANFDIETASAPQLRAALKTRNQQYDDLVAKMTSMEKKILSLDQEAAKREKEVSRKDKELKGLRWIINNGDSSQPQPLPPGVLNHSLLSPTSTLSESDQDSSRPAGSSRRVYYQSDSGTESHAESMSIRSAASGSESVSSHRHKGIRKPSALAEVTYNFYRNASTRRPSKLPPGLGTEKTIPEMPTTTTTNNRTALNSVSSSPSSSTSSLLPPSPSMTMSSLSAIPEGPLPSTALRPGVRYEEERRASHRVSTSSMTSSSTAASSSAYSGGGGGNIKRSRPPSIAQVLEKSPIMDDVLEKLRPFA